MLPAEVIRTSQAEHYSQAHLVKKPVYTTETDPNNTSPTSVSHAKSVNKTEGWRFTVDFRNLNRASTGMGWPIPNIQQMLRRLGEHKPKYFGKLDFTSGYHQAPLAENSRWLTAFITFMGVFEWCRVPMGLKGAGAYFQGTLASIVLAGLIYFICELYIDDLIIHAQTPDEFATRLEQVLQRLDKYNIKVHPDKCELGLSEVEYVGHTINQHGLAFSREKIDKVLDFDTPILGKDLKSFLGIAVYFIDHIKNYANLVRPLHKMITNYERNRRLIWSSEGRESFEKIKEDINNCPTLFFLDDNSPIFLMTDASDYGIGGYLCQIVDDKEISIAFVSHGLNPVETRWSTIEKECYAIVYSLKKLHYLLEDCKFIVRTDHLNLNYLDSEENKKVKRWKIEMQHYDITFEYIQGPLNVVADGFSCLLLESFFLLLLH